MNPRFFNALERASDAGVDVSISASVADWVIFGVWSTNDQTKSEKGSPFSSIARYARALPIKA
ncbi:hypothetical protein D3C72_2267540 [compost metagenome]